MREKREFLGKITNELAWPGDEEDFLQTLTKIKARVKAVFSDDGRRMVSLMVNQLKVEENSQARLQKMEMATQRRRLLTEGESNSEHLTTEENFVLQKNPKKLLRSHRHLKKFNDH